MKTPDEIKSGLRICVKNDNCDGCPYGPCGGNPGCVDRIERDALAYIEQLEEHITLMKVQMHGDCGVCKHRAGNSFDDKGVHISDKCGQCMTKETRPHWEYEGLPEVKANGKS